MPQVPSIADGIEYPTGNSRFENVSLLACKTGTGPATKLAKLGDYCAYTVASGSNVVSLDAGSYADIPEVGDIVYLIGYGSTTIGGVTVPDDTMATITAVNAASTPKTMTLSVSSTRAVTGGEGYYGRDCAPMGNNGLSVKQRIYAPNTRADGRRAVYMFGNSLNARAGQQIMGDGSQSVMFVMADNTKPLVSYPQGVGGPTGQPESFLFSGIATRGKQIIKIGVGSDNPTAFNAQTYMIGLAVWDINHIGYNRHSLTGLAGTPHRDPLWGDVASFPTTQTLRDDLGYFLWASKGVSLCVGFGVINDCGVGIFLDGFAKYIINERLRFTFNARHLASEQAYDTTNPLNPVPEADSGNVDACEFNVCTRNRGVQFFGSNPRMNACLFEQTQNPTLIVFADLDTNNAKYLANDFTVNLKVEIGPRSQGMWIGNSLNIELIVWNYAFYNGFYSPWMTWIGQNNGQSDFQVPAGPIQFETPNPMKFSANHLGGLRSGAFQGPNGVNFDRFPFQNGILGPDIFTVITTIDTVLTGDFRFRLSLQFFPDSPVAETLYRLRVKGASTAVAGGGVFNIDFEETCKGGVVFGVHSSIASGTMGFSGGGYQDLYSQPFSIAGLNTSGHFDPSYCRFKLGFQNDQVYVHEIDIEPCTLNGGYLDVNGANGVQLQAPVVRQIDPLVNSFSKEFLTSEYPSKRMYRWSGAFSGGSPTFFIHEVRANIGKLDFNRSVAAQTEADTTPLVTVFTIDADAASTTTPCQFGGGVTALSNTANPALQMKRFSGTGTQFYYEKQQMFPGNALLDRSVTIDDSTGTATDDIYYRMRFPVTGHLYLGTINPAALPTDSGDVIQGPGTIRQLLDNTLVQGTGVTLTHTGTRQITIAATGTAGALLAANNLSDVASATTSLTNLGAQAALPNSFQAKNVTNPTWFAFYGFDGSDNPGMFLHRGTFFFSALVDSSGSLVIGNGTNAITITTGNVVSLGTPLGIASGGTAASTATAARTNLGAVTRQVLTPVGAAPTATAGATYTSAEQTLINDLKAQVASLTTLINNLVTAINQ